MEFLMDFEKTSISTKVGKFLQENLKDEKDKESLQNIITEKGLLKNDAINLLITILQALTIPDSTDDEEITVVNPIEEKSSHEKDGKVSQDKAEPVASGSKKVLNEGVIGKKIPLSGAFSKDDPKNICRFYKNGKCKFNKDCRYAHPPICKTFRKFGLIRFNEKGCSGKCEFFHPNGCRDSLRTKKCERSDCRFFHKLPYSLRSQGDNITFSSGKFLRTPLSLENLNPNQKCLEA